MPNSNPALATLTRLSALLMVIILSGCASNTAVTSATWHDSAQRGARFDNALIVAMTEDGDKRLAFEDELAFDLRSSVTEAAPSSRFMDTSSPVNPETIAPVLAETGAQAVIVTKVESLEVDSVEQAAAYTDVSARRRQGTVFRYDYVEKDLPALVTPEITTVLSTDVFDATNGQLVYTVVTSASGQESLADVINVLSDLIAKQLRKDGVIL